MLWDGEEGLRCGLVAPVLASHQAQSGAQFTQKQASSSSDAPASDSLVTAEKAVATPNSEPLDQAMLEPIGSDAGGASNSDADFKVRCEQFEKFEREFPWRVLIVRPAARDLSGLDRPDKDAAMNHLATIASGIWSGHAVKHLTEGVPSSLCA